MGIPQGGSLGVFYRTQQSGVRALGCSYAEAQVTTGDDVQPALPKRIQDSHDLHGVGGARSCT